MKSNLSYISLFSSAGVGCYGFKQEGFDCVATNEIIEKRLNIQKFNNKCLLDSGYILGDIRQEAVKMQIFEEIRKCCNKKIDVVIATPPCQGMSVANHKKNDNDLHRNSLVVESVLLVKNILPKIFIFENVAAFWKTGCCFQNGIIPIGEMIQAVLSSHYSIEQRVLNFKSFGSNSSRNRTLVIGVRNDFIKFFSSADLFPKATDEKSLREVIGHLSPLKWGEYDKNDFFHSFRIYDEKMRCWIHDLKQGESAFDNKDDYKKPHKIVKGQIVINKLKNGDKYKRQCFDKVAPCVHTRNDQLASQNTVHPTEDRVFSIRELMLMMTIPASFKWVKQDLAELNMLAIDEKRKLSKKIELNIRQSIGEAVPTEIFRQIAMNIKFYLGATSNL